jgi:hypothetical protein
LTFGNKRTLGKFNVKQFIIVFGFLLISTLVGSAQDTSIECAAPSLPGFVPYMVQAGDRLAQLVGGQTEYTVLEIAALNCLDDTESLPIGAVIWLPEDYRGTLSGTNATYPAVNVPAISSFRADPVQVPNQSGVTLSWAAEGLEAYVYLCPTDVDLDCGRPLDATPVPMAGSITIHGFPYAANWIRYRLEVVGRRTTIVQDVRFHVQCSERWIAPVQPPERCAEQVAQPVFAAWQPFEGGMMLWFADTEKIYVLYNEGRRVEVYSDSETIEPPPDLTPPVNRVVPVSGFGAVWVTLGGAEGALGWALADEIGFDSARQPAGHRSLTTYIQGPGATVYAVTLPPGSDEGFWIQVAG